MPITLNASTSSGLITTPDNSGQIAFQNNGTTELTVNAFGIGLGTAVPSNGTGITFPAVQDPSSNANTLDDYEEGSWTPALITGSAQPTFTYTNRGGTYVKIGRQVIAWFYALVSVSSAGNAQVALVPSSLPFTPRSDNLTNSSGSRGGFVTQNPQSLNNVVLTWNNSNPSLSDALYFTTVTGGSTTSGMASGTYAGYVIYEAN